MSDIFCPICDKKMEVLDNGDLECPNCKRHWYETGHEEAPLATRKRRVRLTKEPEPGDNLNDVINGEEN